MFKTKLNKREWVSAYMVVVLLVFFTYESSYILTDPACTITMMITMLLIGLIAIFSVLHASYEGTAVLSSVRERIGSQTYSRREIKAALRLHDINEKYGNILAVLAAISVIAFILSALSVDDLLSDKAVDCVKVFLLGSVFPLVVFYRRPGAFK